MPMMAMMGISALGSLGGGLAGLFGGAPSSNVTAPPMFNMPNMGGAAKNAYGDIGALNHYGSEITPQFFNTIESLYGNPYSGAGVPAAQQGGQYGAGNAWGGGVGANMLEMGGANMLPYASMMMNQGFDPQGELYSRTANRVEQQTRAGLEARGMDMTPYGAGVEGDVMKNFNIDWQDRALGREDAAARGAGSILNSGGRSIAAGFELGQQVPGAMVHNAMLPYSTYNQIGADKLGWLNQTPALAQENIQNYLNYVGTGNQSGQVANNLFGNQLTQANQAFGQNQIYGSQIGGGMYGLGASGFGGLYGGSSFNPYGFQGSMFPV